MSDDQNEERNAAIAFILDRMEQLDPSSGYQAFTTELVKGLAEGRHIERARAGDYDDLNWRVQLIMMKVKSESAAPLVRRRPQLRSVR
jgi:hypothetical protein